MTFTKNVTLPTIVGTLLMNPRWFAASTPLGVTLSMEPAAGTSQVGRVGVISGNATRGRQRHMRQVRRVTTPVALALGGICTLMPQVLWLQARRHSY